MVDVTKVMRGLGTTVKDQPYIGNQLPENLKQTFEGTGTASRQSTTGEKYRAATVREVEPGKERGTAPPLIGTYGSVLAKDSPSLRHQFPAHIKKHGGRIQLFGTHTMTQSAEAALKRSPFSCFSDPCLPESSLLQWRAVLLQELTLLYADSAVNTLFGDIADG